MTFELGALAATALVHLVAVFWSQRALEADVGRSGNMGNRDGLEAQLSPHTQRLRRALANHTENIGLYLIGIVLVSFTHSNSALTAIAAWAYVGARALYLPAYAYGWVPGRSLCFLAGLLSCLVLIASALLSGVL